jgi:hypothetical protein
MTMWKSGLLHTTALRAPETGGGAGSADSGGDRERGAPPARPDHVPEKFWDPAKGAIRADDLAKSYGEAQKLIGKKASELTSDDYKAIVTLRSDELRQEIAAERRRGLPERPDGYRLELSADQLRDLPDGAFDAEAFKDDPLVGWWRSAAHESGLTQEQFAKGIHAYLGVVHGHRQAVFDEEMAKLGANAKPRLEAVQMWLDKNLSKEHAAALTAAGVSADAIGAIEAIIQKAGGPSVLPGGPGSETQRQGGAKTLAELRAMQQDRRYWHPKDKDPAYVAQVQAEYARAFPGQTAT